MKESKLKNEKNLDYDYGWYVLFVDNKQVDFFGTLNLVLDYCKKNNIKHFVIERQACFERKEEEN